ncbi:MAG: hypothetical protein LKG15_07795 [Corynebacterium provencense]|jgi:hypothetical protein|uniref:hypothetical protein n=1 Tax=Corynebacterium provencense TaxID=1737425 RepID=UPI002989C66D|nr:hypothetical protein [Corynebacterium provencense]
MTSMFKNHRPWLRFIANPDDAGAGTPPAPTPDPAPSSEDHSGEDSGADPPAGGDDAGDDGESGNGKSDDAPDSAELLAKLTAERDALRAKIAAHEREQMTEAEKLAADREAAVKRAEDAEAKIAALNREKLVADAAAAAKLPATMADRLRGETAEELVADAKALAQSLGYDRAPVDPSQGRGSSGPMSHNSLADALSAHYGTGTGR